jgi:hypothetical protein
MTFVGIVGDELQAWSITRIGRPERATTSKWDRRVGAANDVVPRMSVDPKSDG